MTRLSGLDALRGVAALLVLLFHVDFLAGGSGWTSAGYLAVDLFFMLSGYVLARTFDHRLKSDLSPGKFLALRIRRLWPMMSIGAALGLASFVALFGPQATTLMMVMALCFLPQPMWRDMPSFPSNPPTWSILAELAANAVHALVLVKLSNRALAAIAATCLIALMARSPDMDVGVMPSELGMGLVRIGFSYTVGILLWRVAGDSPRLACAPALLSLPLLILLGSQLAGWYDFLFVALLCPLILLGCLADTRLGALLGPLSFPLYATHYPVAHFVITVHRGPVWLALLLTLLVSAILAWAMEPGARRWISDRRKPRPAEHPGVASPIL
jgi:peptidoglycan/LPS O-acetylase OafA/YrhL